MQVTIYVEADQGGYIVTVPTMPGCLAQGNTVAEAVKDAQEAIEAWLQSGGQPIEVDPSEPAPEGTPLVVTVIDPC